ncbi:MAG: NAAT family transporter [Rhodobacteraceae bacterium]|nr:NAAT family transporter [Paracoccaceae bacterium]
MDAAFLLTAFATLFVIIDPISLAPMFIALTPGSSAAHRRAVALRACIIGAAVLALFGLFGEDLLELIGISMPAFRIAGGVLLFLTALDMLFERRSERRQGQTSPSDDPSVFPLATPLIAGPGALASMILLTGEAASLGDTIGVYLVMIAVLIITMLMFLAAGPLEKLLGDTGINVVTRLLGMLLAALSVQFVIDGVRQAFAI